MKKNIANMIKISVAKAIDLAETKVENGRKVIALFDKEGEKVFCKHGHMLTKKTANGVYKYDAKGNLAYHKDTNNDSTWYYKDGRIRRWKTTENDTRWNERGDCIYYKTPNAEYIYDDNGNITREVFSDGKVCNYLYDEYGQKMAMIDNYGNEVRYDSDGHIIFMRRNDGAEYFMEYDKHGHLLYEKNYEGEERWFRYDSDGNVIYMKDEYGREYLYLDDDTRCISEDKPCCP